MIDPKFLSAGKTIYKLYHGYNFTPLIDNLKLNAWTLVTFYQHSGSLRLFFVNENNPYEKLIIIERYRQAKKMRELEVSVYRNESTDYVSFPYHRQKVIISDYFQKVDSLYKIDLEKILTAITELKRQLNENLE